MGLKNKLSKMKNFLFDDGEEETKTVKKGLVKAPKKEVKEDTFTEPVKPSDIEDFYLEDVSETEVVSEVKSRVTKQEKEFKFPEFDDDDFMVNRKPKPIITRTAEEEKPMLYQGSKKRKEEVKRFKPSPIISPIYGLLDKDGNKVDEVQTKEILLKDKTEASIDDVRKKAYGRIDEELDNTIKKLSKKTIEEAESDMEEEEKQPPKELSRQKAKKSVVVEENKVIKEEITPSDDDDDMILPNINFKEIDIDLERKKNVKEEKKILLSKDEDDDDDDDTKEQDLFNLIDTMYQEEGKED